VCALPETPRAGEALSGVAAKVDEFGGEATLVEAARLPVARARALVEESRAARRQEYADIVQEAERFLNYVRRETEHRDFTFAEPEELEADLSKLRGWPGQIGARDYFGAGEARQVEAALDRCEEALTAFMEAASGAEGGD